MTLSDVFERAEGHETAFATFENLERGIVPHRACAFHKIRMAAQIALHR